MPQPELRVDQRVRRSVRGLLREALVTGMAVVVPLLITVIVLAIAFQYVYRYLNLFSTAVLSISKRIYVPLLGTLPQQTFIELLTPLVLVLTILMVGVVVNSSRYGQRAVDYFDYAIAQIPGVGSVYESFRKMSDVVIESDMQNFRDVKLVEFPHRDTYTLGFVTAETPPQLADPVGHREMFTLFLPLAPNPVMGGHLVHLPADRVHDVDMSVEEGIRAVVTSGVAVGSTRRSSTSLSPEELRGLSSVEFASQQLDPATPSHGLPRVDRDEARRADSYDRVVSPASATTAADIERRARPPTATPEPGTATTENPDEDADGPVPGTRRSGGPAGPVADDHTGPARADGKGDRHGNRDGDGDGDGTGDWDGIANGNVNEEVDGPADGTPATSTSSTPTPAEVAGRPELAARVFGLDGDGDGTVGGDVDDEAVGGDVDDEAVGGYLDGEAVGGDVDDEAVGGYLDGEAVGSDLEADDGAVGEDVAEGDSAATGDDEPASPPAPDDLMVEEGDVRDGHQHEMMGDSDTVAANGGSRTVDDAGAVPMDDADPDRTPTEGPDATPPAGPDGTPPDGPDATPQEGADPAPAEAPDGASTDRPAGGPEVADE